MSIATLYDVHGNLPRPRSGAAEIPDDATIVVGGDVVAAGPEPSETLERLRALGDRVALAARQHRPRADAGRARACTGRAARRDAGALTDEQIAFLHGLPPTVQIDRMLYCHATPRNDVDIFTERTPEERSRRCSRTSTPTSSLRSHAHAVRAHDRRQARDQLRQRRRAVRGRARRVLDTRPRAPAHGVRRSAAGATQLATRRSSTSPNVGSDLVPIGRVGRPHGIDGSFFVEGPERARRCVRDRRDASMSDGVPVKIVGRSAGRRAAR